MNKGLSTEKIEQMMEAVHASGHTAPTHSSEMVGPQITLLTLSTLLQVHNQPLAALHFVAVFFFGVSCCVLFFYCIQHAAHAGWPIIITRVMEAIASYIPYGGAILNYPDDFKHHSQWSLIPLDGSGINRPDSAHFDVILFEKKRFLNIPFYAVRTFIYVLGASFFMEIESSV
jgi:hypothetical protein